MVKVLVIFGVLPPHNLLEFLFETKEFDSENTYEVSRKQQTFLVNLRFRV